MSAEFLGAQMGVPTWSHNWLVWRILPERVLPRRVAMKPIVAKFTGRRLRTTALGAGFWMAKTAALRQIVVASDNFVVCAKLVWCCMRVPTGGDETPVCRVDPECVVSRGVTMKSIYEAPTTRVGWIFRLHLAGLLCIAVGGGVIVLALPADKRAGCRVTCSVLSPGPTSWSGQQ